MKVQIKDSKSGSFAIMDLAPIAIVELLRSGTADKISIQNQEEGCNIALYSDGTYAIFYERGVFYPS